MTSKIYTAQMLDLAVLSIGSPWQIGKFHKNIQWV